MKKLLRGMMHAVFGTTVWTGQVIKADAVFSDQRLAPFSVLIRQAISDFLVSKKAEVASPGIVNDGARVVITQSLRLTTQIKIVLTTGTDCMGEAFTCADDVVLPDWATRYAISEEISYDMVTGKPVINQEGSRFKQWTEMLFGFLKTAHNNTLTATVYNGGRCFKISLSFQGIDSVNKFLAMLDEFFRMLSQKAEEFNLTTDHMGEMVLSEHTFGSALDAEVAAQDLLRAGTIDGVASRMCSAANQLSATPVPTNVLLMSDRRQTQSLSATAKTA